MEDAFIWWKHGCIYHLYLRSFYDSNHDGIGDIRGVIEKLTYLHDLGVDAIWLSPIFKSPQKDFGYDIEDYQSIEPSLGTTEDFVELLAEAKQKNIRIILDMVLNHTSDKHPWFIESRSSTNSPKRHWYIWKDKQSWGLPNNWRTSFGEKAWTYDRFTHAYYFHTFFKEQPDLNWRKPEVKKAMFDHMKYWLELGVDGFRLDVINCIVKDKKFRNNPNVLQQMLFKKKVYSRNRKPSIAIVKSIRKLLDSYPDRVSIGEIYTLPPGDSKLVGKYLGNGKNALHMALDFSLMFTRWSPKKYASTLQNSYTNVPENGWTSLTMSNHDILRGYSKHYFYKTEKAKLMAVILFTAYGTPFIYYGEEIGMDAKPVPRRKMKDSAGKQFWPLYKGRDKLRRPMQWDASPHAGFSKADPWLPVNHSFSRINVQNQLNDNTSLLNLFKELISLRKKHPALQKGLWQLVSLTNPNVLAYKRVHNKQEMMVFINFSRRKQNIETQNLHIVFSTHNSLSPTQLNPFEGRIVVCDA